MKKTAISTETMSKNGRVAIAVALTAILMGLTGCGKDDSISKVPEKVKKVESYYDDGKITNKELKGALKESKKLEKKIKKFKDAKLTPEEAKELNVNEYRAAQLVINGTINCMNADFSTAQTMIEVASNPVNGDDAIQMSIIDSSIYLKGAEGVKQSLDNINKTNISDAMMGCIEVYQSRYKTSRGYLIDAAKDYLKQNGISDENLERIANGLVVRIENSIDQLEFENWVDEHTSNWLITEDAVEYLHGKSGSLTNEFHNFGEEYSTDKTANQDTEKPDGNSDEYSSTNPVSEGIGDALHGLAGVLNDKVGKTDAENAMTVIAEKSETADYYLQMAEEARVNGDTESEAYWRSKYNEIAQDVMNTVKDYKNNVNIVEERREALNEGQENGN